jgi:N-acetylglucosamine-6-sulfatase
MSRALAAIAVAAALLGALPPPVRANAETRPNIIVLMTDDLDTHTADILPRLRSLLHDRGMEFTSMLAADPLCCPNRASFITGQYVHNHGVRTQLSYPEFGQRGGNDSTIATWMQAAGYRTAAMGKYLNGYGEVFPTGGKPPGWDWSGIQMKPEEYFEFDVATGTGLMRVGPSEDVYSTDWMARQAEQQIARIPSDGKPLLMYIGLPATHGPLIPAARHREAGVPELRVPRTPDFNEDDVSDKPSRFRGRPKLTDSDIEQVDEAHRNRQRMMYSVEDLIERLYAALDGIGQRDQTYIILTSDNGYHLGHRRDKQGKREPHETDIRLPLVVVGPDVHAGTKRSELVSMIDLAPTIADLAGADAADFVDGRSIAPLLRGDTPTWRRMLLVERLGRGRETWRAIRTATHSYVNHPSGEEELYDLAADPRQVSNILRQGGPSDPGAPFRAALDRIKDCRAATCRSAEDAGV